MRNHKVDGEFSIGLQYQCFFQVSLMKLNRRCFLLNTGGIFERDIMSRKAIGSV